jgi:hypothetical protein
MGFFILAFHVFWLFTPPFCATYYYGHMKLLRDLFFCYIGYSAALGLVCSKFGIYEQMIGVVDFMTEITIAASIVLFAASKVLILNIV